MRKILLFTFITVIFIGSSCNKKIAEVDGECSSGVVLIQNSSYYELETSVGSIYFTNYDPVEGEVSGLQFDEDSIQFQISYGTGFFVSYDGKIATNKHVVTSNVSEKDAQRMFEKILKALKLALSEEYDELDNAQKIVRMKMGYALQDGDYVTYDELDELDDMIIERKEELSDNYSNLSEVDHRDAELHYYNKISIAYNNTYVTDLDDFEECVVKSTSDAADIAIIQLKDKKTPSEKFVFEVCERSPLEKYSFFEKISRMFGGDKNDRLVMIGFNFGPALAFTEEGIRSQINEGSISQDLGEKLMYSIPALHGSSGSPVLNRRGQLVAINYAGLEGTQSFNYGIREELLYKLLDE